MEPPIQTSESPLSRQLLNEQLRENYGKVVYTHKTHEKMADIYEWRDGWIRIAQIVISGISSGGAIAALALSDKAFSWIAAVVATISFILNAYLKNYNLSTLAEKHKQTALDLWLIREKYLSLLTDLKMGERPVEKLQAERDKILLELHKVYKAAFRTNSTAYHLAQVGLKEKEELSFGTSELDQFLPESLRIEKGPNSQTLPPKV